MIRDLLHSVLVNGASRIFLPDRTILHGEWRGDRTICVSFDCDYESDMLNLECLSSLLDKSGIRTSFAIPGRLIRKYPEVVQTLINNKHEIVNHTFMHPNNFRNLSAPEKKKEIAQFQELMRELFGYCPEGFRCPHLLHQYQEELVNILRDQAIKYDSSILGNCVLQFDGILEVPLNPCPQHPYQAFDSYHHFYPRILSASLGSFLRSFRQLISQNSFVNIYLDPRDLIGKIPLEAFKQMICLAKENGFSFLSLNEICSNMASSCLP